MTDPKRTRAVAAGPRAPSGHLLTRAILTASVAALLAAGCSVAGATAPPASAPGQTAAQMPAQTAAPELPAGSAGSYVALGDSYTAAPGISSQVGVPAGCGRSTDSYPLLVAQRLGVAPDRVRDVSCDGATIADLTGPQVTGDGTNPAQLTALSPATTLVTLGVGGNDAHWGAIMERCAGLDLIPALIPTSAARAATPCEDYYTAAGEDQVQRYIQSAAAPLAAVLADIKHRAPHARVYVVGYPDLMPASGDAACARTFGITEGDLTFLDSEEQRLNGMLRQQADAAGAAYVDTYTPSLGHDACAAPDQRWIEPWLPASPAKPLHPDAVGERDMANAIVGAVNAAR
jgi:lysophospholipase L1-like esterase